MTECNITDNELLFLIDPESLRELAPCSLKERASKFSLRFPGRVIQPWTISSIMRKAGIRKKAIIIRKQAARLDARKEEFAEKIVKLADFMERLYAS